MAAEIPQETPPEVSAAEIAIQNETIDRLAVFAVRNTAYMEPPIDVPGFISDLTGLNPDHVQLRMTAISAGGDHPLNHNEKTGRLQINPESPQAEAVLEDVRDEILIGNKDFSTNVLRSLLASAVDAQRAVDHARILRTQYVREFDFSPDAPHRGRGYLEKLAEHQNVKSGGMISVPGPQVIIRAPWSQRDHLDKGEA